MPPRASQAVRVWRTLLEEAGEDAIEEASAVSVAQAERDLTAVGFDVAAERATAEAIIRTLLSPRSPRRRD